MPFYSEACRVEYIQNPKVACTSIKTGLFLSDGITGIRPAAVHDHSRWRNLPDGFEPQCVFTFVRHPLDRLVSAYHEKLQTGRAKQLAKCPLPKSATFAEWVEWVTVEGRQKADRHWKPQWLVLRRDMDRIDFFGRYETIEEDWMKLRRLHGLPPLPKANITFRMTPWQMYYDSRTVKMAEAFYHDDLLRFNYTIDDE